MSSTPSWNVAVLNSGRGSRPGFSSSVRMSVHGRQAEGLVGELLGGHAAQGVAVAHHVGQPLLDVIHECAAPPDTLSGWTDERSSGLSPVLMRRKPAACSNVLSPRRGTFLSASRFGNAPLASRNSTILLRQHACSGRTRGPAAGRRRCSRPRPRRSRSLPPRRPARVPARAGSHRAGTGPRRSTSDRSSRVRPAGLAGGGRSTPRRAATRPVPGTPWRPAPDAE